MPIITYFFYPKIKENMSKENTIQKEMVKTDDEIEGNIFENLEKTPTVDMKYDVQKLISEKNKKLEEFQFKKPTTISFIMNESQRDILTRSLELYGSTDLGVSRILTKVFVKKILRTGSIPDKSQKSDIQIKNAADWPYC